MLTLESRFFPLRSAVCFLVEGTIIILSVIASYSILHAFQFIQVLTFKEAVIRGSIIAFFCQGWMYLLDLYDFKIPQAHREILFSLILVIGFMCIGIGIITYTIPGFGVDARMYYLTLFLVVVLLLAWRISYYTYLDRMAPSQSILVVGTGDVARVVGKEIQQSEMLGFKLIGFVGPKSSDNPGGKHEENILGDYGKIGEIVRKYDVSKIVVAIGERRGEYPVNEMLALKVSGYQVLEWQSFFEKLSGRIPIDNLAPSYFIFNKGFRKSKSILFLRRVMSTIIAFFLLLLLFPLLVIAAIMIKIDSPGPVIYSQNRMGHRGKIFRMYKFRSMVENAEADGIPRWADKGDARVTRVGKFLRITRFDELPQLFNVIQGDLDLVGPRPERPEFVEQLNKLIPYYSLRHTLRPGLTGWAQITFPYGGTIEESKEKLQYDLFYVKNMSIVLDLFIIFSTIKIVLLGRGAR